MKKTPRLGNIFSMTRLDKILLYVLGAAFMTALFYALVKNLAAAIFIAILSVILVGILTTHFVHRKNTVNEISVYDMENVLALLGAEQTDFVLRAVPPYFKPEKNSCGFTVMKDNQKILFAVNYKFSATNLDDTAKYYRFAKKNNISEVRVLGRAPSRSVYAFANGLDVIFRFIPSKKLRKYLASQNALMPKRNPVKTRKKIRPKIFFGALFDKSRAKYFALSGLCLVLFSFFGTARFYYLALCAVCFALSAVCALRRN